MNQPPKGPQSGPYAIWDVKDYANLQLKYTGSLTLDCMPGLEVQADNNAAAIDQLIANIGGAEILRDHGIWQIIIGEEMHISSGAFYFSVHRTLAENTEFLCEKLGLALPDSYERARDKTQVIQAPQPPEITETDLFGPLPEPEPPSEETQVVRPKPPAPRGVQRWTRKALLGGTALLAGFLAAGIALRAYRTDPAKHTEVPSLTPIKPPQPVTEEFIDDCRIRFIPETGAYRGSCAVTQGENIKPQLCFRKRSPEGELIGFHEADLSFSRRDKICTSKRGLRVIPRKTTEFRAEVFTCVAPPPK